MAEPQTLDLLGGQIDMDQVAGALSALIPQQEQALPTEEVEPVQMASAEVPAEVPAEQAPAEPAPTEPASVEPAPVEPTPVAPAAVPQVKIFEYEGQRFRLPADVTQEELNQIISQHESTPAYAAQKAQRDKSWERENIDSESGAPASVRAMVGELETADEKLATLNNYYPGTVPYGEDNFLFFDPDTKKFTLYNPPGLDLGDFASLAKTGFEVVGGTLGGLGGTILAGPGAGTYGGLVAGTEFGARAFDTSTGVFGGRVRAPKTIAGEFAESGTRAALTVGGEIGGRMLAEGGKRVLTGVSPTVRNAASDLIAKFESLGIEPVGAAIGRKGMLGRAGAGLEQRMAAAPIMQKQAEKVVVQLDDALRGIASKMGQVRTPNEAGAAVKASVEAAEKRVRDGFSKKYDEVFDEIGADTLVTDMSSVNTVLQPFLKQIAELPADAQPTGQLLALVKKYDALSKFTETGNLTFKQLRDLRTQLRLIRSKKTSGTQGDYDRTVEDIYKAITDDLSTAANNVNPELGAKLKAIDVERAIFADTAQKTFDKIRKFDADNQAYEYIMTSAKGTGPEGIKALQRLRDNFTPEEWGDVAGSALYNLGRENVGAQVGDVAEFSVATFMKNLSQIKKNGPEGMEALFGGTQFAEVSDDLMNLVDVVGALKEVKRYTNFSNTAGAIDQMIFWGSLTGAGERVITGELGEAAVIVTGSVLAPVVAAKLMTSPGFIKWLATPATEISKDVAAHMGRLAALSAAEPEIQEELRQYYKAIRSYTGYTDPVNEGTAQ
jgi:hypothetical protein